jgi:hypothetical protein
MVSPVSDAWAVSGSPMGSPILDCWADSGFLIGLLISDGWADTSVTHHCGSVHDEVTHIARLGR